MARPSRPWYWMARDGWYVTIEGQRHLLAAGKGSKAEAERAFHRLMVGRSRELVPIRNLTVERLRDLFLERARSDLEPSTHRHYLDRTREFVRHYGSLRADAIRPFHVHNWLRTHRQDAGAGKQPWSDATARGAITVVKAMFSWGRKLGYLESNPLAEIERPEMPRRRVVLTATQAAELLASTDDPAFRDLLVALHQTGARATEIARLQASDIDPIRAVAILVRHKTGRKTATPRMIQLTPVMLNLCQTLAESYPDGPLFRTRTGRPWDRRAMRREVDRLRKKLDLPKGAGVGSLRHLFTDDALEAGVDIGTVAKMLGHSDTKMILKNYSRIEQRKAHMQTSLAKVRPGPDSVTGPEGPNSASESR